MVSLQELNRYLHNLLIPSFIKDSCPNGLQLQGRDEVFKVATAVSASLATIEEAIKWEAGALIVHHGLFWNRDEVRLVGSLHARVKRLLEAKVSLFAYHLPLDMHQGVGNNWVAAKELKLCQIEPFGDYEGQLIGVKAQLAHPVEVEEWVEKLEKYYGHKAHVMLGGFSQVHSVAFVSGGGHRFLSQVVAQGIDCLVTGSFDEPIWWMAQEEKKHFIALGHYNTEKIGPRALAAQLGKDLPLNVRFIDGYNPF